MTTDPVTAEELLKRAIHENNVCGYADDWPVEQCGIDHNYSYAILKSPQLREAIEFGLLKPLYVAVVAAATDLNYTMPDTGDTDPLSALDDALQALTTALEAREQKP